MGILQSHLMQLVMHRKEMSHNKCNYSLIHQIDKSYCSTIRVKGKIDHPQNVCDQKSGVILFQEYFDEWGSLFM